jgi:hypothetical protein
MGYPFEILSGNRDENRIHWLAVAHCCAAQHPFDRAAQPFRQRDREPVPRRHVRLDAVHPRF